MIQFLRSLASNSQSRFAHPHIEQLEGRDCPAVLTLNATVVGAQQVQLSGQLDSELAGIEIRFSGSFSGSTYTDSSGMFSYLADGATLGTVYAVGVDQEIEFTNIADAGIVSNPPMVWIDEVLNTDSDFWTFNGRVSDEYTAGMVVVFGGAAEGLSTTVNEYGYFSLTCLIYPPLPGNEFVTGMTTDWWGLESNLEMRYMM